MESDEPIEILAMPLRGYAILIRRSNFMRVILKLQKKLGIKLEKDGLMELLALPIIT